MMTREEAKEILQGSRITSFRPNGTARAKEALNMAIEALSAEAVHKPDYSYEADMVRRLKEAMSEPKTGEWIEVEVFHEVYDIEGVKTWGSEMQCDQCGFRHTAIEGHMAQYNFCPNCGADMIGEKHE